MDRIICFLCHIPNRECVCPEHSVLVKECFLPCETSCRHAACGSQPASICLWTFWILEPMVRPSVGSVRRGQVRESRADRRRDDPEVLSQRGLGLHPSLILSLWSSALLHPSSCSLSLLFCGRALSFTPPGTTVSSQPLDFFPAARLVECAAGSFSPPG